METQVQSLKDELEENFSRMTEIESDLQLQCSKYEDLLNDYESLEESAMEGSKVGLVGNQAKYCR